MPNALPPQFINLIHRSLYQLLLSLALALSFSLCICISHIHVSLTNARNHSLRPLIQCRSFRGSLCSHRRLTHARAFVHRTPLYTLHTCTCARDHLSCADRRNEAATDRHPCCSFAQFSSAQLFPPNVLPPHTYTYPRPLNI